MGIRISQLMRYAKDESLSKDALAHIADIYMIDGGPGSGNHHHKGRPGYRGGSGNGGQSDADSPSSSFAYGSAGRRELKPMSNSQVSAAYKKAMPKSTGQPTFGYAFWHKKGYSESPIHAQMLKRHRQTGGRLPKATSQDAAKAKKYTYRHGVGTKALPYGTGVTRIDTKYLGPGRRFANTLFEYSMVADGQVVLSPQREQLHHAIVDDIFSKAKKPGPGQPKVFTMLGGGTAAGKSTVTKAGALIPDAVNSPVIDADELKANLPEYADEPDRDAAAAMCHLESSVLSKRCLQAGWVNGYNVTLDGTGDGNQWDVKAKLERARHYGYKCNSVYVTCPTETAIQRAKARGQATDRYVPQTVVRRTHVEVSNIWPKIAPLFDHTELYDSDQGEGKPPKLIASCELGGKIKVYDRQAYKRFLAKGLESY